jgi:site-specific recombinase XerD
MKPTKGLRSREVHGSCHLIRTCNNKKHADGYTNKPQTNQKQGQENQVRPPSSSSYIHGFYRAARAFGNWLEKQQLVEVSPLKGLQLPKLEEKQLQPLTEDEEKRLLEAYKENTPSGCRIKAILMLMLDTVSTRV